MIFVEEIVRGEWDWLAIDEAGHLALFSTAGCGIVPNLQAASEEMRLAVAALLRAPELCGAKTDRRASAAGEQADYSDWEQVARRGVFAFDYERETDRYCLIAEPDVAISAARFVCPAGIWTVPGTFTELRFIEVDLS
jgi:hypothetical protein